MAADLQKFLFKSKFLRKNTLPRTLALVLIVFSYILVCIKGQECQVECQHGRCVDNKCVCDSGWEGPSCQFCGGRIRLWSSNSSVITDGAGNYSEDNQCAWLIDATKPNATIRLHLDHFATECSWDHLYVFDGNSIYDPLLAVFSGMVVQDDYSVPYIPEVVAKSGFALLYFYSDAAYNLTGFSISYKVEGCASTVVGSECSGHGVCLDGVCTCDAGWGGAACSVETCPKKCSGNGQCHPEEHRCDCQPGFTGTDCGQQKELGWWEVVGHDVSSQVQEAGPASRLLERSSQTAILLDQKIWVIGGHSFTKKPFALEYDIQGDKWASVEKSSIKEPTHRYGHSAVTYNGSIYIFGGMKEDGSISNELWRLEPSTRQWSLVIPEREETSVKGQSQTHHRATNTDNNRRRRDNSEPITHDIHNNISTKEGENQSDDLVSDVESNDEISSSNKNGVCSSTQSGPCAPIAVVGHTCVVVQKGQKQIMLVLFGHSDKYGYLSTVQEYKFELRTWTTAPSHGAVVNGVYGHTAVWDPSTSLVYIHGGLKSEGSNNHVVAHLITYNPNTHIWSLRRPAPVPRFLHSSVLVGGLMLVFGGNTHNDTAYSYGAKCYSMDFMAYDITCDRWHTLSGIPRLYLDVARYGHSATVYKDSMYIIGGFNGKMLGSVLKYTLGECNSRSSKECLGSYPGRKCVWNRVLDRCEAWSNNDKNSYDECQATSDVNTNLTALCEQQSSCQSCVHNTYQCFWCGQDCSHNKCSEYTKSVVDGERCDDGLLVRCKNLHRCPLCRAHAHCDWQNDQCVVAPNRTTSLSALGGDLIGSEITEIVDNDLIEEGQSLVDPPSQGIKPNKGTQTHSTHRPCSLTCNERTSCTNCTESHCMWCFNQQRCVRNNSYLVSFPYGQCREWTTEKSKCMNIHKGMSRCSLHETCSECQEDVACGWCDDGSGTGIGRCMEGGQRGPINSQTGVTMAGQCKSTHWFFTECPLCNCNGHSYCHADSSECETPCANNTEGAQCQHCIETFFGKSINGGLCEACSCNNHGETCNRETGRCNCHTKGVTGDHCERCDTQNNYRGEPLHGSCFYDLQIDYQFTFNLSKHDDRHIRQINFFNTPTKSDVDTDFDIGCSKPAKIKISAKTTGSHEAWIVRNFTGKRIKQRFSASEYRFGSQENNTTFHVYVYNFTPPIEIIVSFSQHPKLDLIQFFSIFSLCFLILLILAAILWKIKQKYDLYTRRQRLLVEMEAMASRPFRPILLELDSGKSEVDNNFCNREGTNGTIVSNTNSPDSLLPDLYDSQSFRKRKKENPSPIALEPCCGNRAAVLSLLVQLPTGGDRHVPYGHPGGLAITSTLVTLGTPRKNSIDPINIKGDVNKNKTRSKQQYFNQSPDTCI